LKKVTIVGIGTNKDTVTLEGLRAIENADILIGGQPNLAHFEYLGKKSYAEFLAANVCRVVNNETAENITVLMSGDVGFYSGAAKIADSLKDCDVKCLPGISTVQAFFAKLKLPWQDAKLLSMHGGNRDIVSAVRDNFRTFCVTSRDKAKIADMLIAAGMGTVKIYVGENLGHADERVFETTVDKVNAQLNSGVRTVFLFENCDYNG